MSKTLVKGIKFGTWEQYKALTKDPDYLYFITNKGGTVYRGQSLVIPARVIEETSTTQVGTIGGNTLGENKNYHTFTIETFSTASGGTQADPVSLTFSVYSKEAIDAVTSVLRQAILDHSTWMEESTKMVSGGKASNLTYGHTRLTDTVDMTGVNNPGEATGGTAVTPLGVYNAISEAIGGIGGAMVFKGQVGNADIYDNTKTYEVDDFCEYDGDLYKCSTAITTPEAWNSSHWDEIIRNVSNLPTNKYEAGWTYRVCAPGTYAGQACEVGDIIIAINNGPASGSIVINDDWTVGQVNTDGTVTISENLVNNTLVLGSGSTSVKPLANGTAGQYLRIENGIPTWVNHPNTDHGIAKCYCDTAVTTYDKVATLVSGSNFQLVPGAIVAVAFTYLVSNKEGAITLAVGGTTAKPVYFRGSAIGGNVIDAGDTATFMYNGTQWDLLSVDKNFSSVAVSGDYDDLIHKPIHVLVNSQSASVTARTVVDNSASAYPNRVFVVKFTNGIIFDTVATPTLTVTDDAVGPNTIISAKNIMWHGSTIASGKILAGDTVTMVYDGTYFNVIAIDRKIDTTPTSGSNNLITSGGVYQAIQDNALWWEEMPNIPQS